MKTILIQCLVGGVIGGIIGWLTNYLAILMLFHPHKRLSLFGRDMPFGHGVLPSRQRELADVVGQRIEHNFLNIKTITARLHEDDFLGKIRNTIKTHLNKLRGKNIPTYKELTTGMEEKDRKEISRGIAEKVSGIVINMISEKAFQQEIRETILKQSFTYLNSPLVRVIPRNFPTVASKILCEYIRNCFAKTDLSSKIANKFLSLCEIPPADEQSLGDTFTVFRNRERDVRAYTHKKVTDFANDPELSEQMKNKASEMIARMIEGKLGILSHVISVKAIYQEELDKAWQDLWLQGCSEVATKTSELVVREFTMRVDEIAAKPLINTIGDDVADSICCRIGERIEVELRNYLNSELFETQIKVFIENICEQSVIEIWPGCYSLIDRILDKTYSSMASALELPWNRNLLISFIGNIIDGKLSDIAPGTWGDFILKKQLDKITESAINFMLNNLEPILPEILESLDIPSIVKKEIIRYNMKDLEQEIKMVAGNELGWIIKLGLFLGILIGAVTQPMLSYLLVRLGVAGL